jgi:hypothetical protein
LKAALASNGKQQNHNGIGGKTAANLRRIGGKSALN